MLNLAGHSIGRYHILEQLGEGGMAIVYKAYDTHLECDVAIKFIRMDMLVPAEVEIARKRFQIEAKKTARLEHANIVRVTDFGEYQGIPYLVMPYLSGGTLKQKIKGALPYQEAARLLAPIARALEYAHQQNIIHRDIKPSNILLNEAGQPMLSDFGVAKVLVGEGETSGHLTGTGVGIGTPEYMAPEQVTGSGVDARTDIYALGLVFFEMVIGRRPFIADTPMAVAIKQVTDPLPRPKGLVPDLPEEVEQVLIKALAKQPEDRFQQMGQFADRLERFAIGPTVSQTRTSVGETVEASRVPALAPTRQPPVSQSESTGGGSTAPTLTQNKIDWKRWIWLPLVLIAVVAIFLTVNMLGWANLLGKPLSALPVLTSTLQPTALPTQTILPSPTTQPTSKSTISPSNATVRPTPSKTITVTKTHSPPTATLAVDGKYSLGIGTNASPKCPLVFLDGVLTPAESCPQDFFKKLNIGVGGDIRYLLVIGPDSTDFKLTPLGNTYVEGKLVGCRANEKGAGFCLAQITEANGTVYTIRIPIQGIILQASSPTPAGGGGGGGGGGGPSGPAPSLPPP